MVHLVPVLAAEVVLGIDPQQVGDVGIEAVEDVQLPRVHRLLHHVGVVVAHLRQAIAHVFRQSVLPRLEDQPQMHAFKRRRAKLRAGRGDGEVEALAVRQDAVARVEPERVRLAGLDREAEVEHVAHRPDRIFDLDVHRDVLAVRRLEVQRRQIDGDAVEAGVHVLPAVGGAMALVGLAARGSPRASG